MSDGDRYTKGDARLYRDWGTTDVVALPHQCQSWIIGERVEVETLIKDLTELLRKLP